MIKELQQRVYSLLSSSLSVAVYDTPSRTATLPYVLVGEDFWSDASTKDAQGYYALITIHIYSAYKGMKEVKEIANEVVNLLRTEGFLLESMRFWREEEVVHGVVQMRIKLI